MLPNFFVVGAQKAGTTALHNYLIEHPDVFLPQQKETKFFVDDSCYTKGLDYYEKEYFSDWEGQKAVGEVDPDYMYFDHALERILSVPALAKAKFIFIFRNPVERAFSHYLMTYRRGLEALSFEEAVNQEKNRLNCGYHEKMHYSYCDRGFYCQQVERFMKMIPKSKVLFLITDDLVNNLQITVKKIFEFIDVDDSFVPSNLGQKYHEASIPQSTSLVKMIREPSVGKKIYQKIFYSKKLRKKITQIIGVLNTKKKIDIKMSPEIRSVLLEKFSDEIDSLSVLIDRDLSHWIIKYE